MKTHFRYAAVIVTLILAGCSDSQQQGGFNQEQGRGLAERTAGSVTATPQTTPPAHEKPAVVMPAYDVVDREKYDAPDLAQQQRTHC